MANYIRMVMILAFGLILMSPAEAVAWGPHPDIGIAAGKALDKEDPFLIYIKNDINSLGNLSWMNDFVGGVTSVRGVRMYPGDVFFFPGFPRPNTLYPGHGMPETGSYEPLFRRTLQAMQTETLDNFMFWLGSLMHDTQDTGAPPHALFIQTPLHGPMESWVDASKIDITGYKPKLLGKTEDQAVQGFIQRMKELHVYGKERGEKILPHAQAKDRPACEPLILECALESARATADVLHTIGYLQTQMKPPAGTGGLSGTIKAELDPERMPVRVMLQGTSFSTLSDLKNRYEFRNLPPGKYTMVVLYPRYKSKTLPVTVEANKENEQDVELQSSGNLLRNGDLSVFYAKSGTPEGWIRSPFDQPPNVTWVCEPVLAKPGQAVRLTVKWKPDAKGHAIVGWKDKGNKHNSPLEAGTESKLFLPPSGVTGTTQVIVRFVTKSENADLPIMDLIENVCMTAEEIPATMPATEDKK